MPAILPDQKLIYSPGRRPLNFKIDFATKVNFISLLSK